MNEQTSSGVSDETQSKRKRPSLRLDSQSRALLRRFLAEWVWPRRYELAWTLVLTGCLAAATGGYPTVIKLSFDTLMAGAAGQGGEASASSDTLTLVLAAIIGITAVRSLFLYLQNVATNRFVFRIATDMQQLAFAHLVKSDFARLTRDPPGLLVSKLTNDITFVQMALTAGLNSAIRDMLTVFALVIAMLYLDWQMTLIVLGVYPFAAFPIAVVNTRLRRIAKRAQRQLGEMISLLAEKLGGARLIKSFQLERYASDRLTDSFEQIFRLRMKAVKTRARLNPMLEALGGVAIAGVIAFAYLRISSGIATVGDFMGFVTALLMAAQPIRALGNLAGKVQEGLAGAESFYALLDEKPQIKDRPNAKPIQISDGTIAFNDVSFKYDTARDVRAVRHLNLQVPGGMTVALVGRSGGGKSTIINLVPRLFEVTDGTILIDGQDIRDVTLHSLRGNISIVSQDITLFDDTVAANIELGRLGASRAEIESAAEAAAATHFIRDLPHGFDTVIGTSGGRLSGGQRQRIALARAILKDAPILLLDEATSALDNESEKLVQQALAEFTRNRTTIVIAHRLSTVQSADKICVIDEGRIVEEGSHEQLLQAKGYYATLAQGNVASALVES